MNYQQQLQSPKWQQKRLEIMQRDKFHCQACDSDEKQLTVHHYKYRKNAMAWEYDDSMLVTLCSDCHKEIHKVQDLFNVDFVKFKPKCDIIAFSGTDNFIEDCGSSFLERYKNIFDAFERSLGDGCLNFASVSSNRIYVFGNIDFDLDNNVMLVGLFYDAKY